jgi:hypothetical protein
MAGQNGPIRTGLRIACVLAATLLAATGLVRASTEEPADGKAAAKDLAEKLSNPIADLVSVPFQFNWNQGVGPNDSTQFLLNFQPVIPFTLTKDWNLVTRWIMPYVSQPELFPGGAPVSGLGDVTFSLFLSPNSKGLIWGVGPVFGLPMTTDPALGTGKWLIGPTAVALYQTSGFTMGALVNQQFSFANVGNEPRPYVSIAFMQPFLAYTTQKAMTFTINSESTYNWEAESGQRWTVPVNFIVSQLVKFGPFPSSIQIGAGYYAAHPDNGPKWKLRMAFVLILPRGK